MGNPNDDTTTNSPKNKKQKTGKIAVNKNEEQKTRGVNVDEEISILQPIGPVNINSPLPTNSIADHYKGNNVFDGTTFSNISKPKVEKKEEGKEKNALKKDPTITDSIISQAKSTIVPKKDKTPEKTTEPSKSTPKGSTVKVENKKGEEKGKKMVTTKPEKKEKTESKDEKNVLAPTTTPDNVLPTTTPAPVNKNKNLGEGNPLVKPITTPSISVEKDEMATTKEKVVVDTNTLPPSPPDSVETEGDSDGAKDVNDFKELMQAVTGKYLDTALNVNAKATAELTGDEMEPKELYEKRLNIKEGWDTDIAIKEVLLRDGVSGITDEKASVTVDLGKGEEAIVTKGDQVLEMDEDDGGEEDFDENGTIMDVLKSVELPGFDLEAEKAKEKNRVQQYEANKAVESQFLEQRAAELAAKRDAIMERRQLKEKEIEERKHKRAFAAAIAAGAHEKEMALLKEQQKRDADERQELIRKNKEFAAEQVSKLMAEAAEKNAAAKKKVADFMAKLPEMIEANKSKNQELLTKILAEQKSDKEASDKKDSTDDQLKRRMSAIDAFIAEKRAKAKELIAQKKAEAEKMVKDAIAEGKERNGTSPKPKNNEDRGSKMKEIVNEMKMKKEEPKVTNKEGVLPDTVKNTNQKTKTSETVAGKTSPQPKIVKKEEETTKANPKDTNPKTDEDASLDSLNVITEAENKVLSVREKHEQAGHKKGLMVGRSVGYGMKIEFKEKKKPEEKETFKVTKFSVDGSSEEDAKVTYINDNMRLAEEQDKIQPGYHTGYCKGYNEGHNEGRTLKRDADKAAEGAKLAKDQKTDEYKAGALLGLACGAASASRKPEVEATFIYMKENASATVHVKAALNDIRSAAFDQKQTPGGELSGPIYENAFMQHYNVGYQQAKAKQFQGPEIDEDYKTGYEPGYKLGSQKANGESGDQELIDLRKQYEGTNSKDLEKSEKQKSLGFFAGYNQGYKKVKEGAKNAVQAAQEKKYKDPSFMAGYATGSMKGFLTVIIQPSGIDLLSALNDPNKMEEAGVPDYFPIPQLVKDNIKATLIQGDVEADENTTDATKALLAKPLFKEGLQMGYNQGYSRGQKSRLTFKQDKVRLHPDYQAALQHVENEMNIGELMAEAQHKLNQLENKSDRSVEDEAEIKALTNGLSELQAEVDKESKYYQRAVLDCYNTHLAQKSKNKLAEKSAKTIKNRAVWDKGNEWGAKVGEKVVEGKEQLKKLNANRASLEGLDISARRATFNKAIQDFHKKAKIQAKKDGEDYYNGYIVGYNAELLASKEAKKSDMGNKDIAGGLKDAKGGKRFKGDVFKILEENFKNISELDLAKGIKSCEEANEDQKPFEDGAAQGYNIAYSTRLINPETRKIKDQSAIKGAFKKHIKDREKTYGSSNSGDKGGDNKIKKWGKLYFFITGYHYFGDAEKNPNIPFGVPKGFKDANDYNDGFNNAYHAQEKDDNEKEKKPKKTTDAYKAGYEAAKYRVRYEQFKDKMIDTAITEAEVKETSQAVDPVGEKTTDTPPPSKVVQEKEENPLLKLTHLKKSAKETVKEEDHSGHYEQGASDAEALWTKIIYVGGKVNLAVVDINDNLEDKVTITDGLEIDVAGLENKDTGVALAQTYLKDKDKYIDAFAEKYKKAKEDEDKKEEEEKKKEEEAKNKKPKQVLDDEDKDKKALKDEKEESVGVFGFLESFFGGFDPIWKGISGWKYNEIQREYRDGYLKKITTIEGEYKKKLMDKWLRDLGFAMGAKVAAQDAVDIKIPEPPYHGMSVEDADKNDPLYQEGHFEGMKFGTKVKSGVVDPKESELAGMQGGHYKRGFDDGKKLAKVMGPQAAEEPTKASPKDMDLLSDLDEKAKNNKGKKSEDITNKDYKKGYVKGFSTDYWQIRDYEYGKKLGYQRASWGDAFNMEPEDNVEIGDEIAFFNGFNKGRDAAVLGLSEDMLNDGKEVVDTPDELVKSLVKKFAWRNAAIKVVDELKIRPKLEVIQEGKDAYYKAYSDLYAINVLKGKEKQSKADLSDNSVTSINVENILSEEEFKAEFQRQLSMNLEAVDASEKAKYKALFDELYPDAYNAAYAQCLVDLMELAMVVALDKRQNVDAGSLMGEPAGGIVSTNPALTALTDLLLDDSTAATGEGADFVIDRMTLIRVFHEMEVKIEDTEYEIEDDLDEIEYYQMVVEDVDEEQLKADKERIKELEVEVKDKTLKPKERVPKQKELRGLRKKVNQQQHYLKGIKTDWVKSEKAAKEKIESIRLFMKSQLGFDTPLKSNEDILEYIKINLQTSEQGGNVYEDFDLFNNLVLDGDYSYSENANFEASIDGNGSLKIGKHAEDFDLRADVFIKKNGFEFTAKGLDYRESSAVLYLIDGVLVTPKIEGGQYVGSEYNYDFDEFAIFENRGIKGLIKDQQHTLKGGEI